MPRDIGDPAKAKPSREARWVDTGDRPFVPTADYPIPIRVAPALLPTADGKLWPRTFGWPLTLDESRRLSPVEALRKAEAERTKPTPKKLVAWFLMRCRDAVAVAPDLDSRHRLMGEAYTDFLSAQAGAYARGLHNSREQRQGATLSSVDVRKEDSAKWKVVARQVHERGGEDTPVAMAERIMAKLLADGWVPFSKKAAREAAPQLDDMAEPLQLWKGISKAARDNPEMGYFPTIDEIVRFLRLLTKNQPE